MKEDDRPQQQVSYRDFNASTLSAIPSRFGRLTYLASLRDPASDRYTHPTAGVFDPEKIDEILHHQHLDAFEYWLCLTLEEQAADLALYLGEYIEKRRSAMELWAAELSYERLIPSAALPAQRDLFRADLQIVLKIIYEDIE